MSIKSNNMSENYQGSYWRWAFKDSSYWKFFIASFGIWGWATIQSWIQEGSFDPATLVFTAPCVLIVCMSYRHWRSMVTGRPN